MAEFFASTAKGLSDVLGEELSELGIKNQRKTQNGSFFECNWEEIYRLNLQSRVASRFLKPVMEFTAYDGDELYNNVMKRHDFTKYIGLDQTFMVDASVKDSAIRDQRFLAMRVKDAIADQFRDKFGERPNVDTEDPDLRVYVKAYKDKYDIAIDTSGDSLFKRGYRLGAGEAPMKENLAAALLRIAQWDKQTPIVDLSCGSGTILIEAAMAALNIAPGSHRHRFGFQNLANFETEKWDKIVDEVVSDEKEELPFKFYGFDIEKKVIQIAKQNAKRAGVDHVIDFKAETLATVTAPCEKGIIIMNPPYGARLGDEDNLRDVYRDLGHTLKTQFKGWDAWILSGNKDLIMDLKLKASRKVFVYNGSLECRFLKYTIN